jgi:HPt (histidine-containing phosphotransfer) domain-containing protein
MSDSFELLPTFDETALDPLHELQVEGEPSFVGGLIADYLTQVNELNVKIQASQVAGDTQNIERLAHKLKSSSAVLGLTKLAGICLAIENGARAAQPTAQPVKALVQAVPDAVSQLEIYLKKLS